MFHVRRKSPMMMLDLRICDIRWLRIVIATLLILSNLNIEVNSHSARFSAPLNSSDSDDGFKPIVSSNFDPEYIARNVFTETGQYRIFSPVDSDLRISPHRSSGRDEMGVDTKQNVVEEKQLTERDVVKREHFTAVDAVKEVHPTVYTPNEVPSAMAGLNAKEEESETEDYLDNAFRAELKGLENLLVSYLGELFNRKKIVTPDISVEINEDETSQSRQADSDKDSLERNLKRFVRSAAVSVSLPRVLETGRLFFFSGLKKILWPIYIGIQIIKSILFAMFLPSIIGSLGKIAGQGSVSLAGFNRPSETVNDLNFKDNFVDDSKFTFMNDGYAYNQPEASTNHFSTQLYDADEINKNALSRYGMMDHRDNLVHSLALNAYKKANSIKNMAITEGFQAFKRVPASALLLSNFDPFYSPILSRLDSVFQQLGLKTNDENCREKLICFMYADPTKYAPYSNLVSAQLSRELDELRKPTSENPEILRFFKYMKAAKDGQDGVKCEVIYSMCTEFNDVESPAMITSYNHINKLVDARKLN